MTSWFCRNSIIFWGSRSTNNYGTKKYASFSILLYLIGWSLNIFRTETADIRLRALLQVQGRSATYTLCDITRYRFHTTCQKVMQQTVWRMDSLFLGISSTGRRHIVIPGEVNFFRILCELKKYCDTRMKSVSREVAAAVDTEGGTRCDSITPFSDILRCSYSSRGDTLWSRCSTRPLGEFKALQFKGQE